MKKNLLLKIIILFFFIPLLTVPALAKGEQNNKGKNSLGKTEGTPNLTRFNINKIGTYIYGDGRADVIGSGPGYFYPILGGKTANFQSGFLWGGYVGDPSAGQLRVGGAVYRSSLTAGKILDDGTAEDPNADDARIFRVRRDYKTGSLAQEALDEGRTVDAVYNQYDKDWNEWPATLGAPFDDVDADGVYNPSIDIPGVPGADQTIWFVANDLSTTAAQSFYGTTPMGIEVQCTVWGYKQSGALGQMLFKKYLMVNKNKDHQDFNQFYVSYWSDTDIGGGASDFSGCDTVKSLFYTYAADNDNVQYGATPPATGYDFFQGPIIPGNATDTAIFKGAYKIGFKNLPMTVHYFFINGSNTYRDPDQNSAVGTQQWYNLFQGKISTTGADFIDPVTNQPTKFTLYGDPVAGTGWLDSEPGDRRNGGVSGPFTLAYGDTQEVVIAQMSAGGTVGIDHLGAVSQLKQIDQIAQVAYNRFFQLPAPAPMQVVKISELDKRLILNWGWDVPTKEKTESFSYQLITPGDTSFYNFQGYNIYQLKTASSSLGTSEVKKLKTFDIIDSVTAITDLLTDPVTGLLLETGVQSGSNSGLTTLLDDTVDAFTGQSFRNGQVYYFAVTSYSYNPHPQFGARVLENPLIVVSATPHMPDPGVVYGSSLGDSLKTDHAGPSDGNVIPIVVDPTAVTGHAYKVTFLSGKWTLTDQTTGTVLLTNQTNQTGDNTSPIIDGMMIKVFGAPSDFKKFYVTQNANGPVNPPEIGCFAFNNSGFPTVDGLPPNDAGTNDRPGPNQQADGSAWGIHTGAGGIAGDASYKTFLGRVARNDNFSRIVPYDFEIRFTAAGSTGNLAFTSENNVQLPFEVWNTGIGTPNDPSDDFELVTLVNDVNGNEKFDLDSVDHPLSGGDNDPETDWFYIYDVSDHTPGHAGYDLAVSSGFNNTGDEIMARLVFVNWNGGSISDPTFPNNVNAQMPETGTIFRIETTKPNTDNDVFTFTAPKVSSNDSAAQADVNKINVFPNPYYGVNPQEINKYNRFVTFSHLPQKAVIRIFNLAGQLIRTIRKDSPGQFQPWDLLTDNSFPVAGGLYIVYIDMPDLGKSKILKVAIVQEQQILDHF